MTAGEVWLWLGPFLVLAWAVTWVVERFSER